MKEDGTDRGKEGGKGDSVFWRWKCLKESSDRKRGSVDRKKGKKEIRG